jgi:hypothetical protein
MRSKGMAVVGVRAWGGGGEMKGMKGEVFRACLFASYKEKAFSEYLSVTRLSGNSKQRPARKS